MKRAIAVYVGLLALASPAAAEPPVAVVEEVSGKVTGAEFMDYVTPKTVIKLGADSSVVLSYLKSCRREKISGIGTVIVGTDESIVHLADVKAEKTDCDSNQAHATTQADQRSRGHRGAQRGAERYTANAPAHPLRGVAACAGKGTRHAGHGAPRCHRRASAD